MKLLLFLLGAASLHAATATEVIEQIRKATAVEWKTDTVDTIKAGDPQTQITGIATTFAATLDVLKKASAAGKNMIVAHEPTFYNHQDAVSGMENDAVLSAKQAFISEHKMVVFRFHDNWHARRPDGILLGMTKALGWDKYQLADNPHHYALPPQSLATLAKSVKDKLSIGTARYVGDPNMRVGRVALLPGAAGSPAQIRLLQDPIVDLLVIGETREWETVEYVRDAQSAGKKKALLILGHVPSEELGMDECARWLTTLLPGIPVSFIPAGEPFRAP